MSGISRRRMPELRRIEKHFDSQRKHLDTWKSRHAQTIADRQRRNLYFVNHLGLLRCARNDDIRVGVKEPDGGVVGNRIE